jgi:hypothetical protein
LGYNCIVRLSHTTSMLTPHSLFRSKIFFCNMSTNLMRLYYCLNCINYYLLYIYILLCQELLKAGSFQGDFIIITQKAKKRSRKIILNVDLVVGLQICINNVEKANLKVNLSPFTTYLRASSLCCDSPPCFVLQSKTLRGRRKSRHSPIFSEVFLVDICGITPTRCENNILL